MAGKLTQGRRPTANFQQASPPTLSAGEGLALMDASITSAGSIIGVDPELLERINAIEKRGPGDEHLTEFFSALDRYIDAAIDRKLVLRNVTMAIEGADIAIIHGPETDAEFRHAFNRAKADMLGSLHDLIEAARGNA